MEYLISIVSALVIGVLLGVLFCLQIKLVPRRLKRKYNFIMQSVYTVLLTVIVTLLSFVGVSISWIILVVLSFLSWLFSAWLANSLAQRKGESLQRDPPPSPST